MGRMPLAKDIDEVAEVMQRYVKDATVTERTEGEMRVVEVEGNYSTFDMHELDFWGGRMKFVLYDFSPKTDEEIRARGEAAMWVPQLSHLMTARTQMEVLKETRRKVTQTVVEDGRVVKRDEVVQDETLWVDVTKEFARRGMSERSFMRGEG